MSFGFKHGLPGDVDMVLDCRFLPNPHWVDELRPQTGRCGRSATTCWGRTWPGVPRPGRRPARRAAAGVPAGGQGVPDPRLRLHRWPPPLGRHRRGGGPAAAGAGLGPGVRTATSARAESIRPAAVVALGGGHGLSASLRAVRRYAGSVTAVVSVADDGGSSGRLRAAMPDCRRRATSAGASGALADEGSPLARAGAPLRRRASSRPRLRQPAARRPDPASWARSRRPSTRSPAGSAPSGGSCPPPSVRSTLRGRRGRSAPRAPRRWSVGQVAVQNARGPAVSLEPPRPASPPEVAAAILAADQVVIGPVRSSPACWPPPSCRPCRRRWRPPRASGCTWPTSRPQVPETGGSPPPTKWPPWRPRGRRSTWSLRPEPAAMGPRPSTHRVVVAPVADAAGRTTTRGGWPPPGRPGRAGPDASCARVSPPGCRVGSEASRRRRHRRTEAARPPERVQHT